MDLTEKLAENAKERRYQVAETIKSLKKVIDKMEERYGENEPLKDVKISSENFIITNNEVVPDPY